MKNFIIATIAAILFSTGFTFAAETNAPAPPATVSSTPDTQYEIITVNGRVYVQNNSGAPVEVTVTAKNGKEICRSVVTDTNKFKPLTNLGEGKYYINLKGKAGESDVKLLML